MSDAVTDIGLTFPFITLWNACSSPSNTTACAKRRKTYPCLHTLTQTKHCRTRMCTKRMVTVSRGNTIKSNWFSWKDVKEKLSCFHLCKYLQSVRHFVRYSNTRMLHCYLLSMNQNEAISCCLQGNKKSSLVTKFTEITDSNSCLSNTSWMLLPTKLRGHICERGKFSWIFRSRQGTWSQFNCGVEYHGNLNPSGSFSSSSLARISSLLDHRAQVKNKNLQQGSIVQFFVGQPKQSHKVTKTLLPKFPSGK